MRTSAALSSSSSIIHHPVAVEECYHYHSSMHVDMTMMTMTMMIMIRMIITNDNEHTSGTSVLLCWLSSPSLRIHHVPFILATLWDPVVLKNTIQDLRSGDPHPPAMHHHKIQDPQCSCNTRCSIDTPPRDLVFQQYTRKLKTGVLVSATTITPETPRLSSRFQYTR